MKYVHINQVRLNLALFLSSSCKTFCVLFLTVRHCGNFLYCTNKMITECLFISTDIVLWTYHNNVWKLMFLVQGAIPWQQRYRLSCIIRTISIDGQYCSVCLICCDVDSHMFHHSFQRLKSWEIPAADSVLGDSIPSGGLHLITDTVSDSKQSPHIALKHGMPRWDRRVLQEMYFFSKIISVYKMHVNVPIFSVCDSEFTAEMKAGGLLRFGKKIKQWQVCDWPLRPCCGPKQRLQLT